MSIQRTFGVAAIALACSASLVGQTPPTTARQPVTDHYYGHAVIDPYRWLENWNDPEVRAWTETQNRYTRALLDGQPFNEAVRQRARAVGTSGRPRWTRLTYTAGTLFALKVAPPLNQPLLVTLPASATTVAERVVVDPNHIDPGGATTIDFYVPSHDGQLVAVSLSRGGTEEGTVHVFDVATGTERSDQVPRVNGGTAGGSVAWDANDRGFFYTRYPRGNERPARDRDFYQQVYFHKLGTPTEADTYAIGRAFPRIAEVQLKTSRDGRYLLATVSNGDGGEFAHYLKGPKGPWRQLAGFKDAAKTITFGADDTLYVLTHQNAPHGAILKLEPNPTGIAGGRSIYRADNGDIVSITATPRQLVVNRIIGGPYELRVMDLNGENQKTVNIPPISSVSQVVALEQDLICLVERYVEPDAWYRIGGDGSVARTDLASGSSADFSDIVVER